MPSSVVSGFRSGVRYPATCISADNKFILTGGVEGLTGEPVNHSWMIKNLELKDKRNTPRAYSRFERTKNMIYARFGHALVQVYDNIYAIGGFNHTDMPSKPPRSLASCERFNMQTQEWAEVRSMEIARAFFGVCNV